MFRQNVNDLLANLPLILSDTRDPRDISMNRIITLLLTITILLMACYMVVHQEQIDKLVIIWDKLLALLGIQMSAVNMVKRGIDCYKQVKCHKTDDLMATNCANRSPKQ